MNRTDAITKLTNGMLDCVSPKQLRELAYIELATRNHAKSDEELEELWDNRTLLNEDKNPFRNPNWGMTEKQGGELRMKEMWILVHKDDGPILCAEDEERMQSELREMPRDMTGHSWGDFIIVHLYNNFAAVCHYLIYPTDENEIDFEFA